MTTPKEVKTVAVIGNGIIGHGLAQVFAVANYKVRMIGKNPKSLSAAVDKIKESLKRFQTHKILTARESKAAVGRITTSTQLEDAAPAELVVEAVTETFLSNTRFSNGWIRSVLRGGACFLERTAREQAGRQSKKPGTGRGCPLLVSSSAHPARGGVCRS